MEILNKVLLCLLMVLEIIFIIVVFIDIMKSSKRNKKMHKEFEEISELQRQYYLKKISEIKPEMKKRGRPKKKVEEK